MNKIFTFYFGDGQVYMNGLFSLKKIEQRYNPNYHYFKIYFNESNLCIKDKFNNILQEYDLKNIESVIALKKEYLKKETLDSNKLNCFRNITDRDISNQYDLYVINIDINDILKDNYILKGLLNEKLKYVFIGNESNLLSL